MNHPVLRLQRNLRKAVLQGNPWIYQNSLSEPVRAERAHLSKVLDQKGEFLCWAMACPQSPIGARVLSLEKKAPDERFYDQLLQRALGLRAPVISPQTSAYRLVNGEGDLLPGLVVDIYAQTAVLQFDGQGPREFWDEDFLAQWILNKTPCETVYLKPRHDQENGSRHWGADVTDLISIEENGAKFWVNVVQGQKTGFFLDQRENRNYVRGLCANKTVLNLFSYSGGFSVYAGLGHARHVMSVDIAQGALDLAQKNWDLNGLPKSGHETLSMDVFSALDTLSSKYDVVICDPPSLAKSEKVKEVAVQKYTETFSKAAKTVVSGGHLILSSCSSHINFIDFQEIIHESLSKARRRAQILRISGQGPDHPFPHALEEMRYLKFADLVVYE